MTYQVKVNNNRAYQIDPKQLNLDLVKIKEGCFHLIKDNKSYTATILEADYSTKVFKIRIGSAIYDVELKDELDCLAEKLGLSLGASQKSLVIKASMPGLVLDILVEEGAPVKKGDSILILEAMKMENVIKAARDGVITSIKIDKGASVEKDQILVYFE